MEGRQVSCGTIRKTLRNCAPKPRLGKEWRMPPEGSAEFASGMERVLDACKMPPYPERPLARMD